MKPQFDSDKPIYLQIAESIEDDILQQTVAEEDKVLSTNQLATIYRINPATAAKGLNMLTSEGILYKKRGIGMFVATGAVAKIRSKRKKAFYEKFVVPLLNEATNLDITPKELLEMINDGAENEQ
ncbi:MAG: GntR family transcriptional regulator [Chloroflexota bacterium]